MLPRRKRRIVLASIDLLLLSAVVWALLSLRYWVLFIPGSLAMFSLALAGPIFTVVVFLIFRVYHIVARYLGMQGAIRLGACVAVAAALWSTLLLLVGQQGVPRSVVLAYVPVGTLAVVLFRLTAAALLTSIGVNVRRHWRSSPNSVPVLVFGIGPEAVQLGKVTNRSLTRRLIGYIDPGSSMVGRFIGRFKVYRLDRLESLIQAHGVEEIYIAAPEQSFAERRALLNRLEQYNLRIRVMPDLESLALGRVSLNQLRGIQGRDLLGREEVPPDLALIEGVIKDKTVLVTGAGGSIGSRIALRALNFRPRQLILLDQSELAIYEIERACLMTLSEMEDPSKLVKVLGSVADLPLIKEVFNTNKVDVVFHAAAYKHVPIVEEHPLAGISNNVLATELLARACQEYGAERFVLISSDKAVRPTSVMGATKRIAELVIQALANEGGSTIFTSVRFGNVLESSGSVFEVFRNQIHAGGPVTVMHKDIVRYFMSLEEATNLVLQAAGMAQGGEVFVLDMGEPIKIDDMARSMIRLMGYDVRTPENPNGDIDIVYTGLRPGEKLVEELVLSDNSVTGTKHARIWQSKEPQLDAMTLSREIEALQSAVKLRSVSLALASLQRIVEGYSAPPLMCPSSVSLRHGEGPAKRGLGSPIALI